MNEKILKIAMATIGILALMSIISPDTFAKLSLELITLAVIGSLPWWVRALKFIST